MFRFVNLVVLCILTLISCLTRGWAEDRPSSYRPLESDLLDSSKLSGVTFEQLNKLPLGDPILKLAYCDLFLGSMDGAFNAEGLRPESIAALKDIRQRGDKAVPLLLKMMERNPDTSLEAAILVSISGIDTIHVDVFVDYARTAIRTRTNDLSGLLASSAAELLAQYGTKEDAELLRWLIKVRPYLGDAVIRKLDALDKRLHESDARLGLSKKELPINGKAAEQLPKPLAPGTNPTEVKNKVASIQYLVWGAIILSMVALLSLTFKKRRK